MSKDIYVKETVTKDGKKKYKAEVWYDGKFYTSKTFDVKALAEGFKRSKLLEAIKGELKPASECRQEKNNNASLDRPMTFWSEKYADMHSSKHGRNRANEYKLVGRLLEDKTLRDFHGKNGAQLIAALAVEWKNSRQQRTSNVENQTTNTAKPLGDQTVRLRLTALIRLLKFASAHLPDDVIFRAPDLENDIFEFELPQAHSNKRIREPSDAEYKKLLDVLGSNGDLADFLKTVDETGCRLGEVLGARGNDLSFFNEAGQIVGGKLILHTHKTFYKTQKPRIVPLSKVAATILAARYLETTDNRPLFEALGNNDSVCKSFDDTCKLAGIFGLHIKDFRRAFINRNKQRVTSLDLQEVVGDSSLLDGSFVTQAEKDVQATVGHGNLKTTAGYSIADCERLAYAFTSSSRLARVLSLSNSNVNSLTLPECKPVQTEETTTVEPFAETSFDEFVNSAQTTVTVRSNQFIADPLPHIPSFASWAMQA